MAHFKVIINANKIYVCNLHSPLPLVRTWKCGTEAKCVILTYSGKDTVVLYRNKKHEISALTHRNTQELEQFNYTA